MEHLAHRVYRLLPTLTLALALCGNGAVIGGEILPVETSVEPSPEARPADP